MVPQIFYLEEMQKTLSGCRLLTITFKNTSPPPSVSSPYCVSQKNVNFIYYENVYSVIQPVKIKSLEVWGFLSFPNSLLNFSYENERPLVSRDFPSIVPCNDHFSFNESVMKVPVTQTNGKM